MNLSMSASPTHQDDPYSYSPEHGCWVLSNTTHLNETENTSTYCYYGLHVIIPIATILVTAMVLAIVGNFMVIITIARHRGMRTRTNLLLANLAVADILVAVLDMPISLITVIKGDWIFSHNFCDFNGFAVGLGFMLSIHTLMWISIHKYISITRPFSRSVTPGKITMMILAAWAWATFYNLTPTSLIGLTDTEYKLGASQCGPAIPRALSQYIHSAINTIMNLALPITIMTFCYYRIFKEVKDHLKRMRHFADESACNSLIEQKQITETLCIVLSVFVLFWLPYIVYSMSLAGLGKKYVPVIANPIAYMFGYMNSACNPIIYALRSNSFRRGFKEIICGADQRGFSGSIYGRRDSRTSTIGGRMVLSFRRSLFNKGVVGREKMQNLSFHGIKRQPKPAAGQFSPVSRVARNGTDGAPERRNPQKMEQTHQQLHKEDERTNPVAYKNMNAGFKVQISQNVNRKPEFCDSCSSEVKANRSRSVSALSRTAEEGDVDEVAQTDIQVTKNDNSPDVNHFSVHPQVDNEKESGNPCNITPQTLLLSHDYKISASQPDVTMHPSPNLNIWVGGSRISSSNRDILVTTLEIKNNQIRSVSVGDVRVTCPSPPPSPTEPSPASCPEVLDTCFNEEAHEEALPHLPSQKFKRKFVWQPSVDTLYGSPLISRRKFHTRKMGISGGMDTTSTDRYEPVPREKKFSTGSQGPAKKISTGSLGGTSKNLLVTNLITSFKKSLTDLFHNNDDHSEMLQPETPNVVCEGVRALNESGGVYHSSLPDDDNTDTAEKSLTDVFVKPRSSSCDGTADSCLDANDGYI